MSARANLLGDVRAEADSKMLDIAFYETPDYRTIIESSDRSIIVGRRGTGKSAIAYKLGIHWSKLPKAFAVHLTADEDQIIGIRPLIKLFGEKFKLLRAGSKIAWKYALLMEVANYLSCKYKYKKTDGAVFLETHLIKWRLNQDGFSAKLKDCLTSVIDKNSSPEEIIGGLAQKLQLKRVEDAVESVIDDLNASVYILVDKLDEGYEPDNIGIGLVDGLVHAIIDINTKYENIRPVVFLRDNIYRAISRTDPDFTRDIEGQILRLHWDEYALFTLVTSRLKVSFSLDIENSLRVWNRCAVRELEGKDGFKKCLRLTLYRPRDILILLNEAFRLASKECRNQIIGADIDITAKTISNNRLEDLHKEYLSMIPGLSLFTSVFIAHEPDILIKDIEPSITSILSSDSYEPIIQQQLAVFDNFIEIIRMLYSIGFVGLYDNKTSTFVFCHDGKDPNKEFNINGRILVHPCYWIALNCKINTLEPEQAEEIYDEYDIEISSETPEQRAKRIGTIISKLEMIPVGKEGCIEFEDWCHQAIKIVFAGALRNVELHPNKNATQRRDVVATNLSETPVWKRIYEDYKSRQIIFEVKNFSELQGDAYRQMLSYLTGEYGNLGFIVCRAYNEDLVRGKELEWMKEMYTTHKVLIVKISGKFLSTMLSKLRSPQKHDAPDKALNHLLDTYTRLYISGSAKKSNSGIRSRRK